MGKGISVFLGLDNSLEEVLDLITLANKNGYDRIFTSFHIPEANYEKLIEDFKKVLILAKEYKMQIIADISPVGFKYLGVSNMDLRKIRDLGIDVLRLDFGFSIKEIAKLTNNDLGIKIEVNASTITSKILNELEEEGANFYNFKACHNYYPRKDTGISEEILIDKNNMLKKLGIEISAFVPSLVGKRGPIYEGLPTLEKHRNIGPYLATKHLFALGLDNVFFGDAMPSEEEIISVSKVKEEIIELGVDLIDSSEIAQKYLSYNYYTNREDAAEYLIRASESRLMLKGNKIEAFNTVKRIKGAITLDNEAYLRYMGELQIVLKDIEADSRVNVIAFVKEEDMFLLDYIRGGKKFRFR